MPVAHGPNISPRSAIVVGLSAIVTAAVMLLFVLWVSSSGDKVDVQLGDDQFEGLDVDRISAEIADRGPIAFPDLVGDDRPIWLNHSGDDPETGWIAFEARNPSQPDCLIAYDPDAANFYDECDPTITFPADGSGLTQFEIVVEDGELTVVLNDEQGS